LEVARGRGVQVVFDMDDLQSQGKQFDVILMIDVFEHLLDPDDTVRRLTGMLREKGKLIISTGYAGAPAYLKRPAEFWYFLNLEHVCMLSDGYIRHISEKYGLKAVFRKYTSHYKFKMSLRLRMKLDQIMYWNTYKWRKFGLLKKLYPFKQIFKTENYPYYPATKDHIVLALEKIPSL
jgi:2-polyprenyl-3-methyl-5-hydroxy-6-metoxy-1,4-benzoquinol methylase